MVTLLQIYSVNALSSISTYDSYHPDHVNKSTVYSQELKLRRICSRDKDFGFRIGDTVRDLWTGNSTRY